MVEVSRELLEELVDDEECCLDHQGACQVHDLGLEPGEKCPQQALKDLLKRGEEQEAAALAATDSRADISIVYGKADADKAGPIIVKALSRLKRELSEAGVDRPSVVAQVSGA